jgi:hypothetical protein
MALALACPLAAPAEGLDLRVSDLSVSRGVAHLGETVEATATVENTGRVGVTHVTVRFMLGTRQVGRDHLIDLEPGGRIELNSAFLARPAGKLDFVVTVDPENQISEEDENNNSARRTLGILSLPAPISRGTPLGAIPEPLAMDENGADLSVVELAAEPGTPAVGTGVSLRARLASDRDVDNVLVQMFVNDERIYSERIGLGGGHEARINTTWHPPAAGNYRVRVRVNPDGLFGETAKQNNQRAMQLVVAAEPVSSSPPARSEPVPAAPVEKPVADEEPPNLQVRVETIRGIHYFDGKSVSVNLKNVSATTRASPSMLGLRRADREAWIARVPVPGIPPGVTLRVVVPWPPKTAASNDTLFVAGIDIEQDIDEGTRGEQDNESNLFRLQSLSTRRAAEMLRLTAPAAGTAMRIGQTIAIRWQRDPTDLVMVSLRLEREGHSGFPVAIDVPNNGSFQWQVPEVPAGEWWLTLRTRDGRSARSGPLRVVAAASKPAPARTPPPVRAARPKPEPRAKAPIRILEPTAGTTLYADQPAAVRWSGGDGVDVPASIVVLDDAGTRRWTQSLGVPLATGSANWSVPEQAGLFGHYVLALRAGERELARSERVEIVPPAVSRPYVPTGEDKRRNVTVDLAISQAGFRDGFFEIRVRNAGKEPTPSGYLSAVRVSTYFVQRLPAQKDADVVRCESGLLLSLEPGEEQDIDLGRDPDCAYGEQGEIADFVFAVVRLEPTALLDRVWVDPNPRNNSVRYEHP